MESRCRGNSNHHRSRCHNSIQAVQLGDFIGKPSTPALDVISGPCRFRLERLAVLDIRYGHVDFQWHRQTCDIAAGRILVPLLLVEGSLPQFAVVWGEREIADSAWISLAWSGLSGLIALFHVSGRLPSGRMCSMDQRRCLVLSLTKSSKVSGRALLTIPSPGRRRSRSIRTKRVVALFLS